MVTMKIVKKTDRVERVLDGIGVQPSISYEAKLTKITKFVVRSKTIMDLQQNI